MVAVVMVNSKLEYDPFGGPAMSLLSVCPSGTVPWTKPELRTGSLTNKPGRCHGINRIQNRLLNLPVNELAPDEEVQRSGARTGLGNGSYASCIQ